MLDVLDFGGGNIASLLRCLKRVGIDYEIRESGNLPLGDRPLVLPGVGAFGAVMNALREAKLADSVVKHCQAGVPFLGVCVGLQVLFESSEESPGIDGLGLLPGAVRRLEARKVPQIGWNRVDCKQGDSSGYVYFVNSYAAVPDNHEDIWYESDYEGPFCAAVKRDNVCAFQFHPEKSGAFGHQLIKDWYEGLAH